MEYQSKRDPSITATLLDRNDKYKTVSLKYTSGDKNGQTFDVSESTLKRWWKVMNDDNSADVTTTEVEENSTLANDNPLNIDPEVVNQPYAPNVTPHYIPKPQSVIEYEEGKKKRRGHFNSDLPTFEELVDTFGEYLHKVNEKSGYIKFNDGKGSTIWRKNPYLDMFATQVLFEVVASAGLKSTANMDTARPYKFRIDNIDDYNHAKEAIINYYTQETTTEENETKEETDNE